MIFVTLLFLSFQHVYNFFRKYVSKNLRLTREIPNASAGSWFQFLMVLFMKKYFPISVP